MTWPLVGSTGTLKQCQEAGRGRELDLPTLGCTVHAPVPSGACPLSWSTASLPSEEPDIQATVSDLRTPTFGGSSAAGCPRAEVLGLGCSMLKSPLDFKGEELSC